ncbi:hypothetical protein [Aliiroseovarius sp. YM-037]|uniref:hypothetical protein n=1 Tax=Aliiroseovarius sp. YM-037 TaxID=3341728 RepID=UPI003A80676B
MTANCDIAMSKDQPNEAAQTDETYWGYIIRPDNGPGLHTQIKQAVSGLLGLAAVGAAVAFWALPGAFFSDDVALFKMVASVIAVCVGVFLLWYASAGSTYELHVDTSRNELREMLRNNKGQSRLHRRHEFSDIGEVFVTNDGTEDRMSALMLRIGESEQAIVAARASKDELRALKDRLTKDLAPIANVMRREGQARKTPEGITTPDGAGLPA